MPARRVAGEGAPLRRRPVCALMLLHDSCTPLIEWMQPALRLSNLVGATDEDHPRQASMGAARNPVCALTFMRHNVSMSKKIDSALKDLVKALRKHAAVASDSHVSLKRSQRATAKVQAAATAYAAAVHAKSGLPNPFDEVLDLALDEDTLNSLAAERDAIALSLTGPIPQQTAAAL